LNEAANARASYLHTWCKARDVDIGKLKAPWAAKALDIGRERGSLLEPAHAEQLRGLHELLLQATETTAAQTAQGGGSKPSTNPAQLAPNLRQSKRGLGLIRASPVPARADEMPHFAGFGAISCQ
jgi:hypothetical protein